METMSLAVIHSRAQIGIDAQQVDVEVHLANGLPALSIILLGTLGIAQSLTLLFDPSTDLVKIPRQVFLGS
jgi:hypothetical protein